MLGPSAVPQPHKTIKSQPNPSVERFRSCALTEESDGMQGVCQEEEPRYDPPPPHECSGTGALKVGEGGHW